jgi:membrane associated rhomboid family serine protease
MTAWLIGINVAVYVLDLVLNHSLVRLGWFSAYEAMYHWQVWRFITFQFLHGGVQHIFFNMLALYFFGPMIESYLGPRKFLAFYLLCGISGAVMYLLLMYAGLLNVSPVTVLVGASAGILGVLAAAATVAPNTIVMLLFPPIPMRLRTMAWIFIAIAAFTVLEHGWNAGGEAAHLGGAAMGFLLIRQPRVLQIFDFRLRRRPRGGSWRMDDWR